MSVSITFDVEKDLHSGGYKGIREGMPQIIKILDGHGIPSTLFVPAKLIEKFPTYFKKLDKNGHEIAIHGYEHERFNLLSPAEKERRIKQSVIIYKRIFHKNPRGFRAPQHSIDNETLSLLEKNKFIYDSSCTPFNFLQILSFPGRFFPWLTEFLKPRRKYKIYNNLQEIPLSSFFISFSALPMRVLPWTLMKFYLLLLRLTNRDLVFYVHSWDLIKIPQSRIDQKFSHGRIISNLEKLIVYLSKKENFMKMEDVAKK
jgi:peptidoglycan/xylan/chitin deacetylase (PgdA/CDA1 family)